MNQKRLFGPISQLGYLTDKLEATARAWTDTTGVGPWTLMNGVALPAVMDGEEVEFKIDLALSYQGEIQIELIKPLCDTPSPYRANVEAGLWGLHHVQFMTSDMKTAIKKAEDTGLEAACVIDSVGGGSYTYLRGLGVWFEVIEASEGLLGLFQMIKATTTDWNGDDLFREFGA